MDIRAVIQAQRTHTIRAMQDYTRLKGQALEAATRGESVPDRDDVAWQLVLDQLIFQAEAEARWLDHCETRLVRLTAADAAWAAPVPVPAPGADTGAGPAADPAAVAAGPTSPDPGDTDRGAARNGGLRGALRRSRSRR